MSLFNDRCLRMPLSVVKLNISNGAKFLYMLLIDDFTILESFCPNYYSSIMSVSSRTLYRYFKELLDIGIVYKEDGYFKFKYM